ncbi:MAG TPA: spore germination protein GerW family protein [Thermotogota bacterium]|nr:spore germination protein GerW family protein [Thermotogota bacterium]HRW33767.1 spore germination protein GerW family protein [Thermotogota bacterium]
MKKLTIILLILIPCLFFANEISQTVESLIRIPIELLSADQAVGTPIELEDKIIIPLFKANIGFGGGLGGPSTAYGGGAGGGIELLPYSLIVVSEEGFHVIPVTNQVPFLKQLVEVLPQILSILTPYLGLM